MNKLLFLGLCLIASLTLSCARRPAMREPDMVVTLEPETVPATLRNPMDRGSVGVGMDNPITGKIENVSDLVMDELAPYLRGLDLDDPEDRVKFVQKFIDLVGEEEALWRGVKFSDGKGNAYRWPPQALSQLLSKRNKRNTLRAAAQALSNLRSAESQMPGKGEVLTQKAEQ